MSHKPFTDKTDLDERARRLSACYRFILSWPDPLEEKGELTIDDLGGEAVTDSGNDYPNVCPDQSNCDDAQDAVKQGK